MVRRNIVSDIVQGIIVGGVLGFITFQILTNAYVTKVNGWTTMLGCGEPGNGLLLRAACANKFTGPINVPQEAMYWTTKVDGAGKKLSGQHDYMMHFPAGQLPPNNAFWSLTMSDAQNRFVPNPINRYSVSDRSGLVPNTDGPVPINTLYTEHQALFAEPITSQSSSGSNLMTVGVNHDTLLMVGWLDLSKGTQVLHVPDFSGRYYSVQFTDPFDVDFAYVGTRITGTKAGDYLITGPDWKGQVPSGMMQISTPNNSVLVLGRILVYSDSDLPTAYGLAKQIQLMPLNQK